VCLLEVLFLKRRTQKFFESSKNALAELRRTPQAWGRGDGDAFEAQTHHRCRQRGLQPRHHGIRKTEINNGLDVITFGELLLSRTPEHLLSTCLGSRPHGLSTW